MKIILLGLLIALAGCGELTDEEKANIKERQFLTRLHVVCMIAIEQKVKYASKADFSATQKYTTENFAVTRGMVDLMNGFGAMIPHTYLCRFDKKTKQLLLANVKAE